MDDRSDGRRDLKMKPYNTQKRQITLLLRGFESAITACEQPQTHVLDRVTNGIGDLECTRIYFKPCIKSASLSSNTQ